MPDFRRPFYFETDTSDYVIGAELYQVFEDGQYLVGFFSKKISGLVINYLVYNKEFLVIVKAFKE